MYNKFSKWLPIILIVLWLIVGIGTLFTAETVPAWQYVFMIILYILEVFTHWLDKRIHELQLKNQNISRDNDANC